MNKKHIAILHFAYPPNIGGVEILMQEQADILTDNDYKVTIVTGSGKSSNELISVIEIPELQSIMNFDENLQKEIFNGNFNEQFDLLVEKIKTKLQETLPQFDSLIIHNMMTVSRNLAFTKAFIEYSENSKQNIIVYIHDHMYVKGNDLNLKAKRSDLEEKLITQKIPNAKYIAISNVLKNQLIKVMHVPENEIHVVPNGLPINSFLEIDPNIKQFIKDNNILQRFPIILSPVNIIPRKNLEYSLEVINELKKTYPDVLYIISGDISNHFASQEYLNKLKEIIKKYHLESNIFFLKDSIDGILKMSAIHDLYSISDAIFFFSESENFGLPILEAGLMRRPIFASNLEIFDEIAQDFIIKADTTNKNYSIITNLIIETLKSNESQLLYLIRSKYNLRSIINSHLIPLL